MRWSAIDTTIWSGPLVGSRTRSFLGTRGLAERCRCRGQLGLPNHDPSGGQNCGSPAWAVSAAMMERLRAVATVALIDRARTDIARHQVLSVHGGMAACAAIQMLRAFDDAVLARFAVASSARFALDSWCTRFALLCGISTRFALLSTGPARFALASSLARLVLPVSTAAGFLVSPPRAAAASRLPLAAARRARFLSRAARNASARALFIRYSTPSTGPTCGGSRSRYGRPTPYCLPFWSIHFHRTSVDAKRCMRVSPLTLTTSIARPWP